MIKLSLFILLIYSSAGNASTTAKICSQLYLSKPIDMHVATEAEIRRKNSILLGLLGVDGNDSRPFGYARDAWIEIPKLRRQQESLDLNSKKLNKQQLQDALDDFQRALVKKHLLPSLKEFRANGVNVRGHFTIDPAGSFLADIMNSDRSKRLRIGEIVILPEGDHWLNRRAKEYMEKYGILLTYDPISKAPPDSATTAYYESARQRITLVDLWLSEGAENFKATLDHEEVHAAYDQRRRQGENSEELNLLSIGLLDRSQKNNLKYNRYVAAEELRTFFNSFFFSLEILMSSSDRTDNTLLISASNELTGSLSGMKHISGSILEKISKTQTKFSKGQLTITYEQSRQNYFTTPTITVPFYKSANNPTLPGKFLAENLSKLQKFTTDYLAFSIQISELMAGKEINAQLASQLMVLTQQFIADHKDIWPEKIK